MKRYVKLISGKIIDTQKLISHMECYFIVEDKLYFETIDGTVRVLGIVVKESDSYDEM